MSHSHHEHPMYVHNAGSVARMEPLPLPPPEGMTARITYYDDVPQEPRFDPSVHLALERPQWVRLLPDFKKTSQLPKFDPTKGSSFAYSAPFRVLSEEGVRVVNEIYKRNMGSANGPKHARGHRLTLRGLYYLSPFLRDFQNCRQIRDLFREVAGEELIPHPSYSSVPQVNVSLKDPSAGGIPLDPWHWDSVAYTGVLLLYDMSGLVGGELELMDVDKREGLRLLEEGGYERGVHSSVVSYDSPGKMIFAQGSEVLHHVAPVLSDTQRVSMIMAYAPANAYQPPKSVLQTMRRAEGVHRLAEFEYFREKAWQCAHALKGYTENVKYTADGSSLAALLRAVAAELERCSSCLDGSTDDRVDFFDEVNKKVRADNSVGQTNGQA